MKLNWAERLVVNNPLRVIQQRIEMHLLRRMSSLPEGSRVLEVGCGRGAGARLVLRSFRPSLFCALDLDIQMVKKAKAYLSRDERQRGSLCVGDVFQLPFKDTSMDAVFGFGVLHHVPDWRGAASEIARVLKAGGLYYMEELYPTAYQNFITRRILLHPREDRFFSPDLRKALKEIDLPLQEAIDLKKIGILAVAVKEVRRKV